MELFSFECSQWFDTDLPLLYQFSYISNARNFLVLQTSSQVAFASSVLPAGLASENFKVTTVSQVYDSFGADSAMHIPIRVLQQSSENATKVLALLLIETQSINNKTSANAITRLTSLTSTLLNNVDCTKAPNCTVLNRRNCYRTAHTCGPCISSDLLGQAGDSNEQCYFTAQDIKLKSIQQQCPGNCSNNGDCSYRLTSTNEAIQSCFVGDLTCIPVCVCKDGFTGPACSTSPEKFQENSGHRENIITGLSTLLSYQDATSDNLNTFTQSLNEATLAYYELTPRAATNALAMVSNVLSIAQSNNIKPASVEVVVNTLNSVALAAQMQPSSLSNSSLKIQSAVQSFATLLTLSVVPDQEPVNYITDTVRIGSWGFHLSNTSADNCLSNISLSLPRTTTEQAVGLQKSLTSIPTCTDVVSQSVRAAMFSLPSNLYANNSFQSNPVGLTFSSNPCRGLENCDNIIVMKRTRTDYSAAANITFQIRCFFGEKVIKHYFCPDGRNYTFRCN
jgi:hypothetical protein